MNSAARNGVLELETATRAVRVTAEAEKRKARTFARQQKAAERIASVTSQLSGGIVEATSATKKSRKYSK
ncbi:hypothetical protein [Sphingomonas jinjuensis]|uniref:hypothetical protein n=1 Tax=Sphingomonas jinjuensis TaxID=535907 RepID=UPI00161C6C5D|nr:hypothetical protein [Sphingomonas jinjuensis]